MITLKAGYVGVVIGATGYLAQTPKMFPAALNLLVSSASGVGIGITFGLVAVLAVWSSAVNKYVFYVLIILGLVVAQFEKNGFGTLMESAAMRNAYIAALAIAVLPLALRVAAAMYRSRL